MKKKQWMIPGIGSVLAASMMLAPARPEAGPDRGNDNSAAAIPRPKGKKEKRKGPPPRPEPTNMPFTPRTIDGTWNNEANPLWGSAGQPTIRLTLNGYLDDVGEPNLTRPSAREISNIVCAQEESIPNFKEATDYLWQWGQFIDHDVIETPTVEPVESLNIPVPAGDPHFDPTGTGQVTIRLNRSLYEIEHEARQQVNEITAYIDGSMVYGSDDELASELRTLDGTGRLRVSESEHGDLLPFNDTNLPNAPSDGEQFFLAGDIRVNEQIGLTALHTLFVREHNYWAAHFAEEMPDASGDEIYEMARRIVGAEIQAITYREWLPVLLGERALPRYRGYKPDVQADISNEFGAAAFRLGHSMLSSELQRIGPEGEEIEAGHLSLADAFFNPQLTIDEGIDVTLRGLAAQTCQQVDAKTIDDVRNFLFGPPGAGGFDLASLNIQRGRDHGIASYSQVREDLGLRELKSFRAITGDRETAEALREAYGDIHNMDLWVASLSERKYKDSMVGETFHTILVDQFQRLRDGDRYFYKNDLPPQLVRMVEKQTLATIIRRNTDISEELPDNVFVKEVKTPRDRRMQQPRGPRPSPRRR